MKRFLCCVPAAALALLLGCAHPGPVEVGVGYEAGPPPMCPYGYFDYPPYACAPDGYYGPEWFPNGEFVGTGPWFHGPAHFHGYVDNRFDPQNGYHGPLPERGERVENAPPPGRIDDFHGNEQRDGRGRILRRSRA